MLLVVTGLFVGTTRALVGQEAEAGLQGSGGGAPHFTKNPSLCSPCSSHSVGLGQPQSKGGCSTVENDAEVHTAHFLSS